MRHRRRRRAVRAGGDPRAGSLEQRAGGGGRDGYPHGCRRVPSGVGGSGGDRHNSGQSDNCSGTNDRSDCSSTKGHRLWVLGLCTPSDSEAPTTGAAATRAGAGDGLPGGPRSSGRPAWLDQWAVRAPAVRRRDGDASRRAERRAPARRATGAARRRSRRTGWGAVAGVRGGRGVEHCRRPSTPARVRRTTTGRTRCDAC
jgi:hypothetical protein